jgi:hypothetical protein
VSGPRKWLRSATSIFSLSKDRSGIHQLNAPAPVTSTRRRLESPVPLSEFAKHPRMATHSGHGRRDSLTSGERTRILRMLRDEGGRLADEDSQVFVGAPPPRPYELDLDDEAAPPPPPVVRPDVPAKPAVVVGLAQARRQKKPSGAPPLPATRGPKRVAPPAPPSSQPPQPPQVARARAPLPRPFDEPTRAVEESELLKKARAAPPAGPSFDDLPTRLGERLFDDAGIDDGLSTLVGESPPKFINSATIPDAGTSRDFDDGEATRLSNINLNGSRSQGAGRGDERTRAVDIRNDRSMSDVDWDID